MQTTESVGFIEALGSYSLFTILLIFWVAKNCDTYNEAIDYFLLFTYFCVAQLVLVWLTPVIPLPSDSFYYFEVSREVGKSGFDSEIIRAYMKPGLSNLSVNSFILISAGFQYIGFTIYEFFHVFSIFVSTIAVYYSVNFFKNETGLRIRRYSFFAIGIFFSWYWTTMQFLRESIIVAGLGMFIYGLSTYVSKRSIGSMNLSVTGALVVFFMRPEMFLFFVTFIILGAVVYARKYISFVIAGSAIPLYYWSMWYFLELLTSGVSATTYHSRMARTEGGYTSSVEPSASSLVELVSQVPITIQFFLVPMAPWNISGGLQYLKTYLHSLSVLIIIALSVIGGIEYYRRCQKYRTISAIPFLLVVSSIPQIAAFSLIDVSGGSAARHSVFFYYLLISCFAPLGLHKVMSRFRF